MFDTMLDTSNDKQRILIADDEPGIRGILYEFLSEFYDCTTVGSAEEALARVGVERFDLVISDITMGGMTGLEMIPHLIERAPDTVVVMISGEQSIQSAIQALRVGAFDYVMKPFDLLHVEAAVRRALEHYSLRTAKQRYENYLEELVEQRTAELDRTLRSLDNAYRATLQALAAALETRDTETHGHSERVVSFSLRLGRELALSSEQLRVLEFGALLHDIGKLGVPDAILLKPGKLTEDEWTKMRQHPLLGQQILSGVEFLGAAAHVVSQHHEKWDGTGYPLGIAGVEIDMNARIFAVADAFDAMISDRIYRPGRSYDAAAAELNKYAGTQFDPRVVEAFHRVPREEWDELRRHSSATQRERMAAHHHLASSALHPGLALHIG